MSSRPVDSASVASAVAELVGLAINRTRRAVDIEMLDFGDQQERPGRNGVPPSGAASVDWDYSEMYPSLRDVLLLAWLAAPKEPMRVVAARARPTGDLRLTFADGSIFEILVDSAGEGRESWRLLRRDTQDHLVVGGDGAALWID